MKRVFIIVLVFMGLIRISHAETCIFNVTVPETSYGCYIVGNFNNWNSIGVKMQKIDNKHYTVTLDESTFVAGVISSNLEYKYLQQSGDWVYVEKYADGSERPIRQFVSSPMTDVVERWATFYPPPLPNNMNVTIDVQVPKETKECYIVGNFNNWSGPRAPADSVKMKKIATNTDGTVIFEKTIYTSDANILSYHFCSGPDWVFEQADPTSDFHYPDVVSTVNSWKLIYNPSISGTANVTVKVPIGTSECYAVGSFCSWDLNQAIACQKVDETTFNFAIPNIMATEFELFNKRDWNYYDVDANGKQTINHKVILPADGNVIVTVSNWKYNLTDISEIDSEHARINIKDNQIVVENIKDRVELFDIRGCIIRKQKSSATFISSRLNPGLYILKTDGHTSKILIP